MRIKFVFLTALLSIAGSSGIVAAQPAAPSPPTESAPLPRDGVVEWVLVNPHGDPDGLLLRDGTLVRFPPHAVSNPALLRVGMQVHAEGDAATSPSGVTLFDATVSSGGRTLADASLPPAPPPPVRRGVPEEKELSVTGKIRVLLTNPDGIIDGFLLEDGTVVHAGPHARLSRLGVAPGSQVVVRGLGGSYPQGRSLHAQTIQVGDGATTALAPRPRP